MNIFTNGCFDILHPGHIKMLKFCTSLGDHITVGIDSDRRVQELKGPSRPVNSQEDRRYMLLSLRWVNEVIIFDTDKDLRDTVRGINPSFMVVGSDYRHKEVIGAEHAQNLIFFEKVNEYSTTNIIQRLTSR